jgi:nitronate monooxygenase
MRAEISRVRFATRRNFGVNIIPAATSPDLLEAQIEVLVEERVPTVALFWDLQPNIVKRLTSSGCLVVCQVGSADEAPAAAAAGARIVIAQGFEAGGHVRGRTKLMNLVQQVAQRVSVPVLAAGGIVNGIDLAAVLGQGAQGAVIGTAFLATRESFAHDYHKSRIVAAKEGETIHTEAFHINWPKGAPVRVLSNSVTRGEHGDPHTGHLRVIGEEAGRPIYLFSTDSPLRNMTGNFEAMALYAGEGAGRINSIPRAAELLANIVEEAAQYLETDRRVTATDPP